jgi:(1->4)-alpha-D-glucan 1-alpha-D-glucosylmutase
MMNEQVLHVPKEEVPADPEMVRSMLRQRCRMPVSTYRLQFHPGFTFRDARQLVPYLARLGITDCYCSPFLRARPGSTHGYDICDHRQLNPELGSEADYEAFTRELAAHDMGQVLDFVPNHMGVDPVINPWWRDVLEDGQASPFAYFFDIDWEPVKPELKGKVLLPVLGDHYGRVLERGELQLAHEEGALILRYGDWHLPIDPRQYPLVLRTGLEALQADMPAEDPHLQEFLSILTELDHLPPSTETAPERVAERQREKKVARDRLARLVPTAPRIHEHIVAALKTFNGKPGYARTFDRLHELLEAQPYRLAFWRTAFHEINYRRFFDIKELAGIRMEEPAVFSATHQFIVCLIRDGKITGLRLDHLDGLFDPAGYLERLQETVVQTWLAGPFGPPEEGEDWRLQVHAWREKEKLREPHSPLAQPLYVVAEKILSGSEALPASWPIHGTSGYDFLNDLNRVFVDSQNARAMRRVYERFTGRLASFADVVYECKKLITWTALASELNVLAHALNRISEGNRRARDFTLDSLREALREVVACFPVYRTYVSSAGETETDRQMIEMAIHRAQRRNPAMEATAFDFLRRTLLPRAGGNVSEEEYQRRLSFAMKFQQYTGPVQAKGVEDTAFYRYNVLVSLNEVGGDPQRFGSPPQRFHEANVRRLTQWPYTMLATATHDTKRGEDHRARLNVLSEIPEEWRRQVYRWTRLAAGNRTTVDGEPAPDRNDEYLFYQALLGVWPAEPPGTPYASAPADLVERLRAYMHKAVNEAKVHTSWINPNQAYDQAVADFVEKTLTGPRAARFLAEFLPFQHRIARLGMVNSLAQVVLKAASPGVPDIYQGTELWDLSLVDPDNRRPVDYARRLQLLAELEPVVQESSPARTNIVVDLLQHWEDGRIKFFLTMLCLHLRRRWHSVFQTGEYVPLTAEGERADHVVALARQHDEQRIIAVVPRACVKLTRHEHPLPVGEESWGTSTLLLPPGWDKYSYRNVVTGEAIRVASEKGAAALRLSEVLSVCPVALLEVN